MKPETQIHVAYAVAFRGGKHYRARAYAADVLDGRTVKHSFAISLDDSAETAKAEAVQQIRDQYRREDMTPPKAVTDHGKKSGAIVDSHLF